MKDIKWLIIPDVHGREFWKEPVTRTLQETDAKICFLGDYHDPYPYEFTSGEDYLQESVDNFKQILELKKKYLDRVTLLIGNHDCGYAIGDDICSSRMDRWHRRELEKLFQENKELFQIAEDCDIAGRHFVFSHAGILKGWADRVWGEEAAGPAFNVVDQLNQAWWEDQYGVLNSLGDYDSWRGWGGYDYGSPIWSDIRSWVRVTPEETFGFNIVGHTQCNEAVMLDTIADLDCRQAFYLDSDGNIRNYESDEILTKTRVEE
jgi:hypothetical protein